MRKDILIVGAGLTGSVIAHELASNGYHVSVFEKRNHVAGNCYTEVDPETGILVHVHGPHIFHTDDKEVWDFVTSFAEFESYICQVKATTGGRVYSLPINLLTINQFYNKTFSPNEAKIFLEQIGEKIENVISFEDQAVKFLGKKFYEYFFKGYAAKQWGIDPSLLPASILKRLPVRFNYNDNYYNHYYQGIPRDGYTHMVDNLLKHKNIHLYLNREFRQEDKKDYDHIFYTGPLDAWFYHKEGRLGYRTLRFDKSIHNGDYQGCAVMSYPEEKFPFTRITEHKYFTPHNVYEKTIIFHEYSSYCGENDIPYYPIRLAAENTMLSKYIELAGFEKNVTFLGRLGTYRYLDMDVSVGEALRASRKFMNLDKENSEIPVFFNDPT
ncbi:UDP-galactopyranose mutase [Bartonella sp. HY406]|uniref:UDP-galactopyranose/dTDP-fucopyranose mutase family protein n=1 Tax=Bartonella sp. HY406 TaxID=2979331 RepID=UPI0021C5D645|nr:UDP-galactopyranose mutase [Bartonella sp. HY406]UXN05132.1 NAD(P)-binding protein [Bartonella sp. HY406]